MDRARIIQKNLNDKFSIDSEIRKKNDVSFRLIDLLCNNACDSIFYDENDVAVAVMMLALTIATPIEFMNLCGLNKSVFDNYSKSLHYIYTTRIYLAVNFTSEGFELRLINLLMKSNNEISDALDRIQLKLTPAVENSMEKVCAIIEEELPLEHCPLLMIIGKLFDNSTAKKRVAIPALVRDYIVKYWPRKEDRPTTEEANEFIENYVTTLF